MKYRHSNLGARQFKRPHTLCQSERLLAALSLCAAMTCAQAQTLQFIPAPTGLSFLLPTGLSADGSVMTGTVYDGGNSPAFRWSSADGFTVFGGLPGTSSIWNTAISGDGSTFVGTAVSNDLSVIAAYRYQNGVLEDLGSLDGPGFQAYGKGVNYDGSVVVGDSSADGGTTLHAFRWTSAGMQDLGALPGGNYSQSWGVSGDGEVVVGSSNDRAFRWNQADGMQQLGSLPGSLWDYAYAANADGTTIVGESNFEPVRWFNGVPHALGAIPNSPYGVASSVSDDGRIIGGGWFDENYDFGGGYVWSEPTGTLDLASLLVSQGVDLTDIRILQLMDMSADGSTLVAWGMKGNEYGAILITDFAVPEAQPLSAAASLLGFGVASSWMRIRRQRSS